MAEPSLQICKESGRHRRFVAMEVAQFYEIIFELGLTSCTALLLWLLWNNQKRTALTVSHLNELGEKYLRNIFHFSHCAAIATAAMLTFHAYNYFALYFPTKKWKPHFHTFSKIFPDIRMCFSTSYSRNILNFFNKTIWTFLWWLT